MHAIVYLALTWIRYFTQKMFSPQEKIIVEFIKMTPFKSLHTLDTVLLPEWSTAVCLFSDSCSRVPCCLIKSILLYKVYETKDNMKSIVAFGFVLLVTESKCYNTFLVFWV